MEDCKLVAAIDFGTTFSGYAFAFTSKPGEIRINKNWGESVGFQVSIPVLIQAYTCTYRIGRLAVQFLALVLS